MIHLTKAYLLLNSLQFFMLTAAAVKITGAGLGNDTCNIHNEVCPKLFATSPTLLIIQCLLYQTLYEEAMSQDITFDQYHRWLERRLDGTPARQLKEQLPSV